jgi:hypothetical protein
MSTAATRAEVVQDRFRVIAQAAPPTTLEATLRALEAAREPVQAALLARVLNVLARLITEVDERALGDAAGARSDYEVLLRLLEYPDTVAALREQDPLLPARLRWLRDRERLLQAEGGAISAEQAAELVGMTRQGVDKRRRTGTLIGLSLGRKGYVYPVWQFAEGGTLPGLQAVLAELNDFGPWMQAAFMLSGDARLNGERPLDELRRGHVQQVVAAAHVYGEQGGA